VGCVVVCAVAISGIFYVAGKRTEFVLGKKAARAWTAEARLVRFVLLPFLQTVLTKTAM